LFVALKKLASIESFATMFYTLRPRAQPWGAKGAEAPPLLSQVKVRKKR